MWERVAVTEFQWRQRAIVLMMEKEFDGFAYDLLMNASACSHRAITLIAV